MITFVVIGAIVLVVGALLGLDRLMAGRRGRSIRSARDGEAGNANAGYALIEQQSNALQQKRSP